MIEAGEALHVRGRVLGEPSGFSEIGLVSDAADLGCQRRGNGKGASSRIFLKRRMPGRKFQWDSGRGYQWVAGRDSTEMPEVQGVEFFAARFPRPAEVEGVVNCTAGEAGVRRDFHGVPVVFCCQWNETKVRQNGVLDDAAGFMRGELRRDRQCGEGCVKLGYAVCGEVAFDLIPVDFQQARKG